MRTRDIEYQPVTPQPGSVSTLVPAPVPAEWWAGHGGYGLIKDQAAEVELDRTWTDPNVANLKSAGSTRWTRALYGSGMTFDRFDPGSCFDRSLRSAGFWAESRAGSLREPTEAERAAALADPSVRSAEDRLRACLLRHGLDSPVAQDPEAELRRQFQSEGLITHDGVPAPTAPATDLERARRTEQRIATREARCRQTVEFDRSYDTAIRSAMGAQP